MQQICANGWCKQSFLVSDEDVAFYDKISPVFHGKKESIPPPTLCPDCRFQRRLLHGNEAKLFRRTSSKSGKEIVSAIAPDSPNLIYDAKEWWADDWDPLSYGQKIDVDRPVFEQLKELFLKVPVVALVTDANENSEYVQYTGWSKNCYLCFCVEYSEDCLFCYSTYHAKNCLDCFGTHTAELCYECVHCRDCYHLLYSRDCYACSDSAYLYDCTNCKDCFGCVGLRQKQYCFFNEQLSAQEYKEKVANFPLSSHSTTALSLSLRQPLLLRHPRRAFVSQNTENVTGDYLTDCKGVRECFDSHGLEDSKYCDFMRTAKDCYDVFRWGYPGELCYECMGAGAGAHHILFAICCWPNNNDLLYCSFCNSCHDCFGCAGLRHKSYCIFNTQYTKEEYEKLVPTLIESMRKHGEWGEFFPEPLSAYAYNHSNAQEYFPLTEKEVRDRGWTWSDYRAPLPSVQKVVRAKDLPDSIDAIPDDILQWAIECEATGQPFKIAKQELDFYRSMRLPIPRFHPDERHRRRIALRNPRHLWDRQCAKCSKAIQTTYAPDRPEIVYCEECYLKEVY